MSELPEAEEIKTTQVPAWRHPSSKGFQYWNPIWKDEREGDLQEVREMLSHLTEFVDWFFVNVLNYDVDVFFIDPKQAMLFKLRHTV